jgi:glycosyltransferase involved in cell wall biosynthesis
LKSSPDLRDRVFYLPFGVNIDKSTIVDNKKEKLTIISLCRLVKSKGVHHLIKIEEYLNKNMVDVDWIIIGDGPEKEQIADQWKNKNNVSFYSPSDDETVKELLDCSDLFISLSEFEGYGISLLEAMSNGLVPIITKLPIGIHSIIDENIGYCEEGVDINKIGQYIIRLSKDISLLNRLKKNSLDFILNNFNAKNTGKSYLKIFLLNKTKSTQFNKRVVFKQFGFLDHKLFPNFLSRIFKRIKYAIS